MTKKLPAKIQKKISEKIKNAELQSLFTSLQQIQFIIIPSVHLFIDTNYQCSVQEIYDQLEIFEYFFPNLKVLPFIVTEKQLESKHVYMRQLINKNYLQHSSCSNIDTDVAKWLLDHDAFMDDVNGVFAPTIVIPHLQKSLHTLTSNSIEAMFKFCFTAIYQQSKEHWNVARNKKLENMKFIVKPTVGTRANVVKDIGSNSWKQIIFEEDEEMEVSSDEDEQEQKYRSAEEQEQALKKKQEKRKSKMNSKQINFKSISFVI
jgi:hypothetical protein